MQSAISIVPTGQIVKRSLQPQKISTLPLNTIFVRPQVLPTLGSSLKKTKSLLEPFGCLFGAFQVNPKLPNVHLPS